MHDLIIINNGDAFPLPFKTEYGITAEMGDTVIGCYVHGVGIVTHHGRTIRPIWGATLPIPDDKGNIMAHGRYLPATSNGYNFIVAEWEIDHVNN